MELTPEQKAVIRKYALDYNKWSEKDKNLKEHNEHHNFFKTRLAPDKIDNLSELDFREIWKKLWASNIWGNKDWYIENRLLKPNGLPLIKESLKNLLYGKGEIDVRFSEFRNKIDGIGISSISEILHFVFPDKYCLWNNKPRTVLPFLKINLLPEKFFKYNINSGDEYKQCVDALTIIKNELSKNGFSNPNFIDLDCFFWFIFSKIDIKKIETKESKENLIEVKKSQEISSHEEAEYYLLKLGEELGYSTYTVDKAKKFNNEVLGEVALLKEIPDFASERDKNSAREIDVIWFNISENPEYCLEVENSTDITKGLTRMFQLQHFNVKFVIVAPEDKRSKFEIEMAKSPFRTMRDRYCFISYEELIKLYESAVSFNQLKNKLLG
jgi:hypothetical protein